MPQPLLKRRESLGFPEYGQSKYLEHAFFLGMFIRCSPADYSAGRIARLLAAGRADAPEVN